ncbi:MAG TPA: 2OG-Fe(II) oxygenase [Ktedonobacteraceae bacterium]|jgi:hypothetical protein
MDTQHKSTLQANFLKKGYALWDDFLASDQCEQHLEAIRQFKDQHSLQQIHRPMRGRSLHYAVIDGEMVEQHLPMVHQLYQEMNRFLNEISPQTLFPLDEKKAGANVNITPPGGQYRWHYDRNEVTALVYLNKVQGGEIEFYPHYRFFLKNRTLTRLQRWLDAFLRLSIIRNLFGRKIAITPMPGRLVLLQGNRCLHSVRPMEGEGERINLVLSYDIFERSPENKALNTYLYTQQDVTSSDPNYT